jgi:pimeloyl-ACP methyl ester carboxylesterase
LHAVAVQNLGVAARENANPENFFSQIHSVMTMKRWHFFTSCCRRAGVAGRLRHPRRAPARLDLPAQRPHLERRRRWRRGMDDVWIPFESAANGEARAPARPVAGQAEPDAAQAPVLLYLHGARYNVTGSAPRMRRMQELGFSVLAIDYRGFGKSTPSCRPKNPPTKTPAPPGTGWRKKYPDRPRYIFGHSLGGPIAIDLASRWTDERGTIVEGTFTSIADVVSSSPQWGWMPVSLLITQRFEAVRKVATRSARRCWWCTAAKTGSSCPTWGASSTKPPPSPSSSCWSKAARTTTPTWSGSRSTGRRWRSFLA